MFCILYFVFLFFLFFGNISLIIWEDVYFFLVLPCWFSRLSRSSIFIKHMLLGGSSFWYAFFYVRSSGRWKYLDFQETSIRFGLSPLFSFCFICLFPVSIPYYMYTSFSIQVVYYAHMSILPIFIFCYLLLFLSLLYLCTPLHMCNYIYRYFYFYLFLFLFFIFFYLVYTHFVGYLFCLNHVSVMPFNSFGLILPYFELEEGTGVLGPDRTVG